MKKSTLALLCRSPFTLRLMLLEMLAGVCQARNPSAGHSRSAHTQR